MTPTGRTNARPFAAACLIVIASVAVMSSSCGRGPTERRPNVLLVTIDTLRDDHCSVSGYELQTTPTLEALARDGARMELSYAPTATTGPTHASILTSLYPIAHGVLKNGMSLDEGFPTLAETLSASGYRTAGVVSSFVLDAKFGYGQGFDVFEDDFEPATATITRNMFQGVPVDGAFDRPADRTTEEAVYLLKQFVRGDEPFFLFVHYFDPHAPYVPPEPFASLHPSGSADDALAQKIRAYDGEISFSDREIGKLLQVLEESDLERDTLVVVTADHGEGLMQRGHMHHGVHIYEEAVRVPLLFRWPGKIEAGRTLGEPVELIDLMPTILELVGVEPGDAFHGRSLAGALAGGESLDPQRSVFLHRRHYEPRRIGDIAVAGEKFGIRVGPWKYIVGEEEGTRELFNLQEDPGELVNVCERFPAVADELQEKLAAWKEAFGREDGGLETLSPEDLERLKALGYVE
jgi:arylsulfatase A-like enzyme